MTFEGIDVLKINGCIRHALKLLNKADILNTKNINLISLFFDLLVTTKNSDILSKKMNYFLKNENFNLKTKHKIESKYKLN